MPKRLTLLLLYILLISACSIPTPLIGRIKAKGELVVVTRPGLGIYNTQQEQPSGLDYQLVSMFAEELGVKARFIVAERFIDILPTISEGKADFAAAGLAITKRRQTQIRFTPSYQQVIPQLVYRAGKRRPKDLAEASEGTLEVVAGSGPDELLQELKQTQPSLQWTVQTALSSDDMLLLVKEQVIDYTIAYSNEVMMDQRFHPELKVAFDVGTAQSLAWAFPHAEDSSLFDAAADFLDRIRLSGVLEQLIERYYGHGKRLGFVDTRTYRRHIIQRLPPLIPYFKRAAEETGLDWQLLAAISYQESHWNPLAVSPTGVKGLMMLTKATAAQLEITDRTDPEQSILGGARYLRLVEKKIPQRIEEPDRLWMALASYNIGFGHLEDGRVLTQRGGGDPDKWSDVKKYLPLLSQKKYHSTVKHGFARGGAPVIYVDNIRGYYDLLVWENSRQLPETDPETELKIVTPLAL